MSDHPYLRLLYHVIELWDSYCFYFNFYTDTMPLRSPSNRTCPDRTLHLTMRDQQGKQQIFWMRYR